MKTLVCGVWASLTDPVKFAWTWWDSLKQTESVQLCSPIKGSFFISHDETNLSYIRHICVDLMRLQSGTQITFVQVWHPRSFLRLWTCVLFLDSPAEVLLCVLQWVKLLSPWVVMSAYRNQHVNIQGLQMWQVTGHISPAAVSLWTSLSVWNIRSAERRTPVKQRGSSGWTLLLSVSPAGVPPGDLLQLRPLRPQAVMRGARVKQRLSFTLSSGENCVCRLT